MTQTFGEEHYPQDDRDLNLGEGEEPARHPDKLSHLPQEMFAATASQVEDQIRFRAEYVEKYGGKWVALTAPYEVALSHEVKEKLIQLCKIEFGEETYQRIVAIERVYAPGEALAAYNIRVQARIDPEIA